MFGRLLRAGAAVSLMAGGALCTLYMLARADSVIGRDADLARFAFTVAPPDKTLWSESFVHRYYASDSRNFAEALAVLRVPSVGIEVPVYQTATELHLNRGVGLIDGMGIPDQGGNVGIAGHRDGFFRALKDIREGDLIVLQTRAHVQRYRVANIQIASASDLRALADTEDPSITLVTCYPFYFIGHAPRRFIVHGTYEWSHPEELTSK
jgi:sortase A